MYVAPVSVTPIGRSLLGEDGFKRLQERLKPGQEAIIVAGDGAYSFKGSGYVRGGIFDRIELLQGGSGIRFRDRNHTRLGALEAEGAPDLREIALFVVPEGFRLDLAAPWQLQLLVQRNVGARDKAFLTFEVEYTLPDRYIRVERAGPAPAVPAPSQAVPAAASVGGGASVLDQPLWQRIWGNGRESWRERVCQVV